MTVTVTRQAHRCRSCGHRSNVAATDTGELLCGTCLAPITTDRRAHQ